MRHRLFDLLNVDRITDPIERRLAPLLQSILVLLSVATVVSTLLAVITTGGASLRNPLSVAQTGLIVAVYLVSFILVRRGAFQLSLAVLVGMLIGIETRTLTSTAFALASISLIHFALSLTIAALLMRRRAWVITFILQVTITAAVAAYDARIAGGSAALNSAIVFYFLLVGGVLCAILDLSSYALRGALANALARERELIETTDTLAARTMELARERENWRVTLASIGDGVISTDASGIVTFMNTVAEEMTGWTAADAVGQPLDRVFHIINEDTRYTVESPVTRVRQTGLIVGLANHTLLIARDGRETPIDDSGAPIRDATGAMIGVVLVFRDVSERKALERERLEVLRLEQQARREAEHANELKLQFLAMISHELRTPLASIKGFASTLRVPDVSFDPDSQRRFIAVIDDEADKLTDLVEQLLDVSRLQAGNLRIQPAPHHLLDIVASARAQLGAVIDSHTLVVHIPTELPPLMVDSTRVAQVLVNLVQNAVNYSDPGTTITIEARVESDDFVLLHVRDQGIGIPEAERPYVFEMFRQVERPTGLNKGVGLGLAICKGLVEAHKGRIWIEDGAVVGTSMAFTLPIA